MNQKVTLSRLSASRKSSAIALGRRYMLGLEISQLACLLLHLPLKRGGRRARPRVGRGGWGSNGRPEKRSPPGAPERADLPFSRGGGARGIASSRTRGRISRINRGDCPARSGEGLVASLTLRA